MFRINYGNGQVSTTFDSYAKASREIIAQDNYSSRIGQSSASSWIQEYMGDGEWSSAHMTPAKKRPHTHRN